MTEALPKHLKKYIVEQNYEDYTPLEQASWRYILRQLRNFLSQNAHECYVEGLQKTGIEIERIPRISEISQKLSQFGWRALPVSGFIPPAAFMELQSLGVLPIASAMRTLDHMLYTPAPDIVHEAAGHAPILIQPDFARYLREYAQVARKALISKEDLDLYDAIRELSDIKESPDSTPDQIALSQKKLEEASHRISHISEAAELGRMNWWTAEYGLIGSLENPKIFGAGLLSSVGESKRCLSKNVEKIPISVDCIKKSYDITEPQPQLYVTPDFPTLTKVLHEFTETMAFRKGGLESVQKAIQAATVTTVQLESGIQISGKCTEALTLPDQKTIAYLRFQGPTQLSYKDRQLPGHDKSYHASGFGTALGALKITTWGQVLEKMGQSMQLEFASGVHVEGTLRSKLEIGGNLLVVSFEKCTVKFQDQILFDPAWGTYDLAVGHQITSVFGGPADRESYGDMDDFTATRVPERKLSQQQRDCFAHYQNVRDLREKSADKSELENELNILIKDHSRRFPDDWLLLLESYELLLNRAPDSPLQDEVLKKLKDFSKTHPDQMSMIEDGLSLAHQL